MKKILAFMLLPLCACVCGGEEMRFITTLSSPVGTFAQLETADPQYYTEAPVVNYCNTWVSSGKMTLAGANAYVAQMTLSPGVTLGGNAPEYRVSGSSGIVMYGGGRITGGRLMANKVAFTTMGQSKSDVENTLYVPSASFRGAKATNLTIPGKVQTANQGSGEELEWSNIYTSDYTCNDKGKCQEAGGSYTSYLLKSKGGEVVTACEGSDCCDPDEEPSWEEVEALETTCNVCGVNYASYRCDEASGKWVIEVDPVCSVPADKIKERCYDWKWVADLDKSCYCSGDGTSTVECNYCFKDQGLYEDYNCSKPNFPPYNINSNCKKAISTAAFLYGDDNISVYEISEISNNKYTVECTAAREGDIGYIAREQRASNPYVRETGCYAYVCTGSPKSGN